MVSYVIPSNREEKVKDFLAAWEDQFENYRVIIVEDNPKKTFKLPSWVEHYAWDDIRKDFGRDEWIISRRNSAIRSYGFWKAYQGKSEIIVTLDDDCLPESKYFLADHIKAFETPVATEWINTIERIYPRGFPYEIRNKQVVLSHGLWSKNPDLDAPTHFVKGVEPKFFPRKQVIPKGVYFPMCGMNIAFLHDFTPLFYFGLQGWELGKKKLPYDRFDDIWCGVIAKKIIDHLDKAVLSGVASVVHSKASNKYVNLVKEAPGIDANEQFWLVIDSFTLTKTTPAECMMEIGEQLEDISDDKYFKRYGKAIQLWAKLFLSC